MELHTLSAELSVAPQILPEDLARIRAAGFQSVICNRPDGEAGDQPLFAEIERAAQALGLRTYYLPAVSGKVTDEQGQLFGQVMAELPKPVLAYCRTGMRSTTMWALAEARHKSLPEIVAVAQRAGYDMKGVVRRIINQGRTPLDDVEVAHAVVIIGGGAAGIATASSLLARDPNWTSPSSIRPMCTTTSPAGRWWAAAYSMRPPRPTPWQPPSRAASTGSRRPSRPSSRNAMPILDGCRVVKYQQLVVCPGLKLDWHAIEGLSDTLGRNGVTSNYLYHLAPYTWKLVQRTR
jgi:sulfide:quinone oxidoreductase